MPEGVASVHINKYGFIDMIVLAWTSAPAGIPNVRCSLARFRDSGKAVGIGHSCAAVSHHRPITAPSNGAGKANRGGSHPGEGEGRGKSLQAVLRREGGHMRSPNTCPGVFIRPARLRAPPARTSSQ